MIWILKIYDRDSTVYEAPYSNELDCRRDKRMYDKDPSVLKTEIEEMDSE